MEARRANGAIKMRWHQSNRVEVGSRHRDNNISLTENLLCSTWSLLHREFFRFDDLLQDTVNATDVNIREVAIA